MSQVFRTALLLTIALAPTAALADDPEYTITAEPVTLKVGQAGALELIFLPRGPWHWNKDYPAKLELAPLDGATAARSPLKQLEGDFKVDSGRVSAAFAVTATRAGTTLGKVTGKIGLCDDKVCVIKKIDVAVSLTATP